MSNTQVYPFEVPDNTLVVDLDTVGGKGLSLSRMTAAGFPVLAGFTVTTAAYRQFVSDNGLQATIIDGAKPELMDTLEFSCFLPLVFHQHEDPQCHRGVPQSAL